jgi:hypothetical protein
MVFVLPCLSCAPIIYCILRIVGIYWRLFFLLQYMMYMICFSRKTTSAVLSRYRFDLWKVSFLCTITTGACNFYFSTFYADDCMQRMLRTSLFHRIDSIMMSYRDANMNRSSCEYTGLEFTAMTWY